MDNRETGSLSIIRADIKYMFWNFCPTTGGPEIVCVNNMN